MIDWQQLVDTYSDTPLADHLPAINSVTNEIFHGGRYGHMPEWQQTLAALPSVKAHLQADQSVVTAVPATPLDTEKLTELLMTFHPWRKGPLQIGDTYIDTEWRSDWKWDRLSPHIANLRKRRVLDVGCGNGYYAWRMYAQGASSVLGVDPTMKFVMQFLAFKHFIGECPVHVLPLRDEHLPQNLAMFDSVFSMGVLYHHRSPIDHLLNLKSQLRSGGELVLETLVIDGDEQSVLIPKDRYAQMRNVWFIPSSAALLIMLNRAGFKNARVVDINITSLEEQRSTPWMHFQSLGDFLDPQDQQLTAEGYPAPCRAIVIAEAP